MSETQNPYAAPASNVASDSLGQDVSKIKSFKRFTTWGVLGLAIITLGIYAYYWMFSRTKTLNTLIPENKIAGWMVPTIIIFGVINILLSLLPLLAPEQAVTIQMLSTPFSIIGFVLGLTWAFKFRNRLNIISGSSKGNVFWLGPILTFFFQLYYFQYKINQMHDASSQGQS
jgi:hypothetical protein